MKNTYILFASLLLFVFAGCGDEDEYFLSVEIPESTDNRTVSFMAAGESKTFKIIAGEPVSWVIIADEQDWYSFDKKEGVGNTLVTVKAKINHDTEGRAASITIIPNFGGENNAKKIALKQAQADEEEEGESTRSKVYVKKAGTLKELLEALNLQETEETMKITGKVNYSDLYSLRYFKTLKYIDLSEVLVIESKKRMDNDPNKQFEISPANTIDKDAFSDNATIETIILPAGIEQIGERAFLNCTSLKQIAIPDILTSIGSFAFANCRSLSKIIIPANVVDLPERTFYECTSLKNITFPENLESIGPSVFENCTALQQVNLPNTVKSIGSFTFANCTTLTKFTAPSRLSIIPSSLFLDCSSLYEVKLHDNITAIGPSAFERCVSLAEFVFPSKVLSASASMLADCTNLRKVKFNKEMTVVGNSAFANCSLLTEVVLPKKIESIGSLAFKNCSALTELILPENLQSIGPFAFDNCRLITKITMSDAVKVAGYSAFSNCSSLTTVTLSSSLTKIEWGMFSNCEKLKTVELSDNIESIGQSAFMNCVSLDSIYIPKNLSYIGSNGFANCTSLKKVDFILNNKREVSTEITLLANDVFSGCDIEELNFKIIGNPEKQFDVLIELVPFVRKITFDQDPAYRSSPFKLKKDSRDRLGELREIHILSMYPPELYHINHFFPKKDITLYIKKGSIRNYYSEWWNFIDEYIIDVIEYYE